MIVQQADQLASGHDRYQKQAEDDEFIQQGRRNFRYVGLASIFSQVNIKRGEVTKAAVWPIPDYNKFENPLCQFPIIKDGNPHDPDMYILDDSNGGPEGYRNIWDWTINQIKEWIDKVKSISRYQFFLGLDSLGKIGWSYIPASTQENVPDVSLYDHSRLVSAIASAMGRYHQLTGTMNRASIIDQKIDKFRFVIGSLSGIQNYIFKRATDTQKGAAKRYRARSFYLSIITELASQRLLRRLELPIFNKIIDAGGRFILLVDNTEQTLQVLQEEARKIQQELNIQHAGLLQLHLNWDIQANAEDFLEDKNENKSKFEQLYRNIQAQADIAKHRDQKHFLQQEGKWKDVFRLNNINLKRWEEDDRSRAEKIGMLLPKNRYLIFTKSEDNSGDFDCLGFKGTFTNKLEYVDFNREDNICLLLEIRKGKFGLPLGIFNTLAKIPRWTEKHEKQKQLMEKMEIYEDEEKKINYDDVITFEQLAYLSCEEGNNGKVIGTPMLGCLKADVDCLGHIFSRGLGERVSIGKIVTLSRQLDQFFKIILQTLFALFDEHIYVIFAGGDDLFLVGTWDKLLELADTINAKFSKYTCENPNITISAGIVFGHGKSPIYELGEVAEQYVEHAKHNGRNRIYLLDRDFGNWDEYSKALKQSSALIQLIKEYGDKVSTSFIYRLLLAEMRAYKIYEKTKKREEISLSCDLLWKSHLRYDIARNFPIDIKNEQERKDNEYLQNWFISFTAVQQESQMKMKMSPIVRLATTYVLYKTRSFKEIKK